MNTNPTPKVTVIGAGSSYTPELINGFLARTEELPVAELWLMDIDAARLDIVGGFAQRMVAAKGSPFEVHLTTDQREAVRDASYVVTQLRVGGMAARREDEYLGRRHGLVGQETTGVGGMAKALRTIPVILNIARDVHELAAPGALLANFANPSGLITEALSRYAPEVASVGVCNVAITTKMKIIEGLQKLGITAEPEQCRLDTLGLNHLSWHRGFTIDGENVWSQVLESYLAELRASDEPDWEVATIEALGMLPNYYLQYYYHTQHKIAQQADWPPSRAEEVMAIEKNLLELYADPARQEPPDELMQRGGAYYSTVATQLLNAHYNNLGEVHIANVPQRGAVPGWPADWVLEMPCRVGSQGVTPLPAPPLPAVCFGLLAHVKAYELLTVEAAVHGDRRAAYQALLAHPLGPASDKIQIVLDDLLQTHAPHLPQF